jgi:hypothetical protein
VKGGKKMAYEDLLISSFFPWMAFFAGVFMVIAILAMIALYVYWAFVLMTIAKKLKRKDLAWLAWIPIANLALFPILAKKHWAWVFIFLVPIANAVFFFIWSWNIFEQRNYPGWLCLIALAGIIPYLGWAASIANLVIWGLVAWKDR